MQRLEQDRYESLRPLFAGLAETQLNVTAVLNGDCPGQVYADDPGEPQTALLVSGDGYFLAGDPQNEAFNTAVNAFLPRDTYFVLFCNLGLWRPALETILRHTYAVRAERRYYTCRQPRLPDWPARVPEGFSLQWVDAGFLSKGLEHTDHVIGGLAGEWRTLDLFFQRGFGFCTVHRDTIVSRSLVDFVDGARCEICIHTAWDYRRRGLGTLTAAATTAYALAHGFSTVGWHCWANNAGSIGVAENVGFVRTADYAVYLNHWAAESVSDMTPDEFRAFAESYERQFEIQPPTGGYPHLVAATAWALAGERGKCFQQLHRAVDVGWLRSEAQLREAWPEFFRDAQLLQMEEWPALRRKLREE